MVRWSDKNMTNGGHVRTLQIQRILHFALQIERDSGFPRHSISQRHIMPEVIIDTFLLIGVGAFVGANVRYVISIWSASKYGTVFPYGTVIVNLTGCVAVG